MRGLLCSCFRGNDRVDSSDQHALPPRRQLGGTLTNATTEGIELTQAPARASVATTLPSPAQPTTGGTDIWKQALERLKEEDRQWLVTISTSSTNTSSLSNPSSPSNPSNLPHRPPEVSELDSGSNADSSNGIADGAVLSSGTPAITSHTQTDEIIHLIRKARSVSDSRNKRNFEFLGQTYSLTDIYSGTIAWLNKFKDIGDIIIQFDPVHAALPWAATRLILHFVIAYEENIEGAMVIIEKTSRIVHRCSVYEYLCVRRHDNDSASGEDAAVREQVKDLLLKLYTLVLEVIVSTGQFLQKRTPGRVRESILRPTGYADRLSELQNLESEVSNTVSTLRMQQATVESRNVTHRLERLLSLEEPILRIDAHVDRFLKEVNHQRLSTILQWISEIQYSENHQLVHDMRTEGTCNWLLQTPQFREWETEASSITLWLHGPAGWGKTYLVSKVVDLITESLRSEKNDEGFAFFYCNHTDSRRRDALGVLRSYVRQLASSTRTFNSSSTKVHPELEALYDQSRINGSGWTISLCQKYILKLIDFYPRTTLVLDALDECQDRDKLLESFEMLAKISLHPVKILISSRPEGGIRQRLVSLGNIEVTAAKNARDIEAFIRESMDIQGPWTSTLRENPALKDEVVTTLVEKSAGMFQWVRLQINQLRELDHKTSIQLRLGNLPEGLASAYDEIYRKIEKRDDYSRIQTIRALNWVLCSYRPLTTAELIGACCVDPETGTVDTEAATTEQHLLGWCANFLILDSNSTPPIWRPSHFSVAEYFDDRQVMYSAQCTVAHACLVVLLKKPCIPCRGKTPDFNLNQESFLNSRHFYAVWRYVAEYWPRHVQTQEKPDYSNAGFMHHLTQFLGSPMTPSTHYQTWHSFQDLSASKYHRAYGIYGLKLVFLPSNMNLGDWATWRTPLVAICYFSFFHLLKDWWHLTKPVAGQHIKNYSNNRNMLTIAAATGCIGICTNLIQRGTLIDTGEEIDEFLSSSLKAATGNKRHEIVEILVSKGADVNLLLQDGMYGSALATAAYKGYVKICELLLKAGADANLLLQAGEYGSALAAAAAVRGNLEMCQLLLEAGADANLLLQAGEYGSALVAAAAVRGNLEICQLLLEAGADANLLLQAGRFGSALAAAAIGGRLEICQLLLKASADANLLLQAGRFGSALAAAAYKGNLEICQLLLKAGSDVNLLLQAGDYGSALAAAIQSRNGSRKALTVMALLAQEADVHLQLQVGSYKTAVAVAEELNSQEILDMLVGRNRAVRALAQD